MRDARCIVTVWPSVRSRVDTLDRVVERVRGRGGHRQPRALRELARFLLALAERQDLEARYGRHADPRSGVPYLWKLSIVCTPQNWPRARSACVQVIGSKSGS